MIKQKKALLVFLLLILFCTSCKSKKEYPAAEKGFINLTNWDFEKDGLVELNGAWEMYHNVLLTPDDFKKKVSNKEHKGYVDVPYQKFPRNGTATCRIQFKAKKGDAYGIRINHIFECYKIWINGEFILENGRIGHSLETSHPSEEQRIIPFTLENGTGEIVIQMSNYHHRIIGISAPIKFGIINDIYDNRTTSEILNIFLLGILFILATYSLTFYLSNTSYRSLLFFFILNIVIIIRIFLVERFMIFNSLPYNYFVNNAIEFMTMPVGVSVFNHFLTAEFNETKSKRFLYFFDAVNLVYFLFLLFFPFRFYSKVTSFYHIFFVSGLLYGFYVVINAIRRKKDFALLFLAGDIVLVITAVLEVVLYFLKIPVANIIPIGISFFIMCQTIIIAMRFSRSLKQVEAYSKNMEEKVKERTTQLNDAIVDKTHFFMNIAHEIKTPLTLINNYFDSFIAKQGLTKELSIIKGQLGSLLKSIVDILNVEKIKMGQILYVHTDIINLSDFLKRKTVFFKKIADIHKIRILSDIENNIFIKMDINAADRVINNLIDNAVKYSKEEGEIGIKLSCDGEKVFLEIKDTGIGIPENEVKNIFNPYYQSESTKKSIYGIGLGLSIIKSIIDSVDGEISVESIPGRGTLFSIVLSRFFPAKNDTLQNYIDNSYYEDHHTGTIKDLEVPFDKTKESILIVENDTELIMYMIDRMRSSFNIYYATNPGDALKLLKKQDDITLIISDIRLDEGDGYQLINEMGKKKKLRNLPVICMSGTASERDRLKGLKMGAVDFISKPFNMEELIHKVKAIIRQNRNIVDAGLNQQKKELLKDIKTQKNSGQELVIEENMEKFNISKREREIIYLILQGKESKEISCDLQISIHTVNNHVKNVFKKCGIQNRIELINLLSSK